MPSQPPYNVGSSLSHSAAATFARPKEEIMPQATPQQKKFLQYLRTIEALTKIMNSKNLGSVWEETLSPSAIEILGQIATMGEVEYFSKHTLSQQTFSFVENALQKQLVKFIEKIANTDVKTYENESANRLKDLVDNIVGDVKDDPKQFFKLQADTFPELLIMIAKYYKEIIIESEEDKELDLIDRIARIQSESTEQGPRFSEISSSRGGGAKFSRQKQQDVVLGPYKPVCKINEAVIYSGNTQATITSILHRKNGYFKISSENTETEFVAEIEKSIKPGAEWFEEFLMAFVEQYIKLPNVKATAIYHGTEFVINDK